MTLVIANAEGGESVRTKLNTGLRNTLIATAIQTANYTATAGDLVLTNSTGGVFTVTLPPTPADGDAVGVLDVTDQWGVNNVTVARNGSNIEGTASNLTLDGGRYAELVYTGASRGWVLNFVSNATQYVHPNHSGDVTSTGDGATAIAAGVIVDADINANAAVALSKLATQAALSVVANATNASAVPTAVAAGSDHQVMRRSGTALAWGAVDLGQAAAVTGTLPVGNGGTGATTHTSGNVLLGAGTSAVTSAKAAPSGDFVGTTDTQTLTNKDISNANNTYRAATDATIGAVELATTAEVRSSATGKALTANHVEDASAIVTLTDAATIAVDWDTFINGEVTITASRTLGLPTNGQPGTWRSIDVIQNGTGTYTLSYASGYQFAGGTAPVVTAAANARSKLSIFCRTASIFEVFSALDIKAPA
jgi:hypothetical protein